MLLVDLAVGAKKKVGSLANYPYSFPVTPVAVGFPEMQLIIFRPLKHSTAHQNRVKTEKQTPKYMRDARYLLHLDSKTQQYFF